MGILNRPSNGSAPVLLTLWRAIRSPESGDLSYDDLLEACRPEGIATTASDQAKQTLDRWIELGLFAKDKNNRVKCKGDFQKLPAEGDPFHLDFRSAVRKLVLAESSNKDFLKVEPAGAADFTLALSWLLATDVYEKHLAKLSSVESLEAKQIEKRGEEGQSKFLFQNDTRWNGFCDWAAFLGFASYGEPFSLDPTEAVRASVVSLRKGRHKFDQVIATIVEDLPVFPGGEYSKRAYKELAKPGTWREYKDLETPPSLTRALLGLEAEGTIQMTTSADADRKFTLLGPSFKNVRTVDHVETPGAAR